MKINTEPSRMSRRRRKWYNRGWEDGKKAAEETTERIQASTAHWRAQFDIGKYDRLAFEKSQLEIRVQKLERDLQFANDRIEQLTNSVVIIRDKK